MKRNRKTSCDVCGRGTETNHAHHVPAHRLDEPNSYTICTRADCDSLGDHITWLLNGNPDLDYLTFEHLLDTLDGHDEAKSKFTPEWERPDTGRPAGEPTHITDYTGVLTDE